MIQKPKGTRDILPNESFIWQYVEKTIQEIMKNYGYQEIRTPVFENTDLFLRGVGDTTDVVQKEMYTFEDKGGRSVTLRPEGTAGVVRAYIENGMASWPSPVKLWYEMAMYRYENVQKGRLREFHQMGVETFGTGSYLADFEMIAMANAILEALGIQQVQLEINSIGCKNCRMQYQKALKEFIAQKLDSYCDTCKTRFEKNPMRILDCKEKKCKENNQGAPSILDYLCEECKEHFTKLQELLKKNHIDYVVNPEIVRGLDYYSKTVFEFVSQKEGFTILGGGRYDYLVKELGGQDTKAVGFAIGMERLIELVKQTSLDKISETHPDLYIAQISDQEDEFVCQLKLALRKLGLQVESDLLRRSIKAQFKYANKIQAKYVITIGETETQQKAGEIKCMETGETEKIALEPEAIAQHLQKK